ncbi:ABC transporter substrate-binding protein [Curvivirga aplysinae]|uniref:ABC transporter substrate-binding protein n=1 Tax=Curvivirga aplysinae TaxID=2529852 RepID=UPI0012BC7035|nr:ABC transporter substrate-binding protein [Curvivirga aplysinae]MTI10151.1 ABC transporter substrate-binding protein [Curvivirga aplysinae]
MKKLLTTSVLAAATFGVAATAQAESLTVLSWGGAYASSQREAYYKPYTAATGTQIVEDEFNGELAKIKAQVEAGNVTIDVADLESATALQGCDEGVLEVIDWSRIPNADDFIPGSKLECGVGTITWATIVAYNTTAFSGDQPSTMADFFDLDKFPGKRGVRKSPKVMLEFALIADGVPAADVYDVMDTEEGIDRAFAKLDTIKDSIVWWESGSQPPQLLADGEVTMSAAWNGRIQSAIDGENQPFKIIWDGQNLDFDMWVIPKGTPNLDKAYDFLKFASAAKQMGTQHTYIGYGPVTNEAGTMIVDDKLAEKLPSAPVNLGNWVPHNLDYWADNFDDLNERFLAWVSQ